MRNPVRSLWLPLIAVVLPLWLSPPTSAVTIDWVTVGDPGNAADSTGFGSVANVYRIGRTEVTNSQYAEFLNAVAKSDPNGLYSTEMGNADTSNPFGAAPGFGGIMQSGTSGSFTYSTIAGRGDLPVNHVTFADAMRFANWLHNGQPTGAQGNATTEDGAYTITAQGVADGSITRNAGATIFITSEDEWYKAAYYDALSASYNDFATFGATACSAPSPAPSTANCLLAAAGDLSGVGGYTGSPGPYGTFDQAGNVWEYTEGNIPSGGAGRNIRGGSFRGDPSNGAASMRSFGNNEVNFIGFRVAMIPEPGTGLLLMGGLLGLAGWRRLDR